MSKIKKYINRNKAHREKLKEKIKYKKFIVHEKLKWIILLVEY